MCKECVKKEHPDRATICIENGSYLVNFSSCAQCNKKEEIQIINRVEDINEEEEFISYQHICNYCDHVIATHEYRFYVEEEFQEYEMNCLLCGHGEDSRSIMPTDPRQQPLFMG